MARQSFESRPPLVALSDANKVVSFAKVELREYGGSLKQLKGGGHQRRGLGILDIEGIKPSVVDAQAEKTTPTLGEKGRLKSVARGSWMYQVIVSLSGLVRL